MFVKMSAQCPPVIAPYAISIAEEAGAIHSVARVLSVFQQCDRDTVEIDPVALGMVHEMIVGRVLAIYEVLGAEEGRR